MSSLSTNPSTSPAGSLPSIVALSFSPLCYRLMYFEVLAALREEGLIRHLGLSNVDTAHRTEARTIAPAAAVQNHFHIAKRADVAVLNACTTNGIAFAPFFPLGGGRTDLNQAIT